MAAVYKITKVDSTIDGHLYVEVTFDGGLVNDFIFTGLRTKTIGPPTDKFGRWLTHDADQHPVEKTVDIPAAVRQAIETFAAEVPVKGHHGDMRDPTIILGGPDPHGVRAALRESL
jgi:hypothetical protein